MLNLSISWLHSSASHSHSVLTCNQVTSCDCFTYICHTSIAKASCQK